MPEIGEGLPHLLVSQTATTELYTSPIRPRGGGLNLPARNRQQHAQNLFDKLTRVREESEALKQERAAFGVDAQGGIYLEFESEPDFELKFESLEDSRQGIELLSVKKVGEKTLATVFVPEGNLSHFENLLTAYRDQQTPTGKPKNRDLVEGISDIHLAVLDALWTDSQDVLPATEDPIWWEVWLRAGDDRDEIQDFFTTHAARIGLVVGEETSKFPDRTVILARGTKSQMARSIHLLNCIAELRKAKDTADFFSEMPPAEQDAWVRAALENLIPPHNQAPAVCILDTGINRQHPLIFPALAEDDLHSCHPGWDISDHHGHGTEMAGLALYGDLTEMLAGVEPVTLGHRLESVKILPPNDQNPAHLYGAITREGVARAEIQAPARQRVVSMAVTTTDFRDRGQPSEWSAAIDSLASGTDDDQRRLVIISAGNTDPAARHQYPDSNLTDGIHDPGQSWNALTVGAFTEKTHIDPATYPGWTPIAPPGDLSPSSTTSAIWNRPWPLKPDIVLEGGNMALEPGTGSADYVDSLELLSTYHRPLEKLLITSRETSAATALASRLAALLQSQYPDFWPETVRALMVHSADWTPAMRQRVASARLSKRKSAEHLLRCYGFGVPRLQSLLWSAQNSLTLIAQEFLQPYDRADGTVKTKDMHVHAIPWPREVLEQLGETPVEMRVTLSYFIEPNPARRGWTKKHRYMSHGLRFDVKTPTETRDEFRARINQAARDEELGNQTSSDASSWNLGPDLRSLGSIHSDRWQGNAVDLAERGFIGVYPVIGWWKERHQLGRWEKMARYSLVVTIKTPETKMDIYNPVATMVRPVVEV
ncbi:S8 family peptidase [Geoalkalibacter halelectricus]|uniref:S8 family peptidase n=1 Tax=Geoalkalibacter halelectricus TaxID=2847045 RepID=UPI003D1CFA8B